MQHGVAVRAHRLQVPYRIDPVPDAGACKRQFMMHMDKPSTEWPVAVLEVHVARSANGPIVVDAGLARFSISLIRIHQHLLGHAFHIDLILREFIRVHRLSGQRGEREPSVYCTNDGPSRLSKLSSETGTFARSILSLVPGTRRSAVATSAMSSQTRTA